MMSRTSLGALLAGGAMCLLGLSNGCGSDETTNPTSTSTTTNTTNAGGGGAGNQGGAGPGGGGSGGIGGTAPTNANCSPPTGAQGALQLTEVITGLNRPLGMAVPWGDTERMFIYEQAGQIQLWKNGTLSLFLDVDQNNKVSSGGERGLLGMAFHPDYVNNGRFFVHYSDSSGDTVIAEYRRDPNNPDVADPNPVVEPLLAQAQPFSNHNGGSIEFSPVDGFLYIGLGDGGDGGDPQGNGQNKNTLLGALLRLDVSNSTMAAPYETPAGNITDGAPEIFDWGLRNPFRFSFDICRGDRYIGDVGQGVWEEIDIAPPSQGSTNWGWNTMEGEVCYGGGNCNMTGLELPAEVYSHGPDGCSVTGGVVYRGSAIPWLRGAYLYSDYCSAIVWMMRWANGQVSESHVDLQLTQPVGIPNAGPSSFVLDNDGELYIVNLAGSVYRLDPM